MEQLLVAQEVWVALASLHREHPQRHGFKSGEILRRAQSLHREIPCRPGVQTHISGHCVANRQPSPNTLRYTYRNVDGTYRLYRDGDDYHPARQNGRTAPSSLPEDYANLLRWYWSEYNPGSSPSNARNEPQVKITDLKVADEIWLAVAVLHRENPSRASFGPQEIASRAQQLHPAVPCRPGVMPHIYTHCVANIEPTSGRYRMLYRNPDGGIRLYRDGDDYHPAREGSKTVPQRAALPEEYRALHDWYQCDYNARGVDEDDDDPLMELVGLGADVWKSLGGGDAFIRWLRSETTTEPLPDLNPAPKRNADRGAATKTDSIAVQQVGRFGKR